MNLIKELEKANFFNFVEDDAQFRFLLQTMYDKLKTEKMIYFPTAFDYRRIVLGDYKGSSTTLDYRSCEVDAEGMLRGGLKEGLKRIGELFKKRNLKFDFENENFSWKEGDNSYIRHEIEINNKKYIIADGNFDRASGSLHYLLQIEKIMNEQLLLQGATEQTCKLISFGGEMIWYVIMEDKHFEIFERNKNEFSASQLIKE